MLLVQEANWLTAWLDHGAQIQSWNLGWTSDAVLSLLIAEGTFGNFRSKTGPFLWCAEPLIPKLDFRAAIMNGRTIYLN